MIDFSSFFNILVRGIFTSLFVIFPILLHNTYMTRGLIYVLFSFIITFIYSDFYSALLHIVFDNENIHIPFSSVIDNILKNIANGFHQHHLKPLNIYTNPLSELLFDMEYVGIAFLLFGCIFGNLYFFILILCFVQLGQMAHRNSHTPLSQKSKIIYFFEKYNFIISTEYHHIHHTTYDRNFAVLCGTMDPVLNYLYKNIKNPCFFQILGVILFPIHGFICSYLTDILLYLVKLLFSFIS